MLFTLLGLPLALVATVAGAGYALSGPGWEGPKTDNFDGRKFRNTIPTKRDLAEMRREGWSRPSWPARQERPYAPPPPKRVQGERMRATFVNHATVLVQVDGCNVLTDPVWSDACGPGGKLGPRRVRNPGVRLDDLPPIDLVLLSHNHYDHLDVPTLRRIAARDRPRIVTGLGNAAFLRDAGIENVTELDWWQATDHGKLRVTATEVRHFSGRGLFDRDRTLWVGFYVETPHGGLYFGGDTGYGPHFAETARRLGNPRLALLPIGAYLPRAVMRAVHIDPTEAVRAHQELGAAASLGIHWGTFPLATDPHDAPPRELARARAEAGLADEVFRALDHGEAWEVPTLRG